ncbi:hypothetical protein [Amycolatopsis sp. NPDC004378]
MITPSPSRNHEARPGRSLTDGIFLLGWEQQSVWGWDPGTGGFYAQLWRNETTSDAPDIWLTAVSEPYPWPSSIALGIVEKTGIDSAEVVAGLGIADPAPKLRPDAEVAALLHGAVDKKKNELTRGAIHALGWAQGYAQLTPSMRERWNGSRPTAARVDAEHHLATGFLYRPEVKRDFFSGVDAALWWLLGRSNDTWFL